MTARSSLTIVLAAGEGTRMRSRLPKVLHPVAGQSLLAHVLDAAPHGTGAALAVVIGPDHKAVAEEVRRVRSDAATFIQAERLGTAHAVLAARAAIARGADDLLIVFGDTPLISENTLRRMRAPLQNGAALTVLGFRAADPTGYGRLLLEGDRLVASREQADGAVIHAFSHIVQASIGKNASVGPYARLRPGTSLGEGARIGNFVEAKAATLEAGVKVNHLSYIGDSHIGANANIGAGTITCNYDGFSKHKTTIGAGAFVGTNSSLVAPVKIGNGAYIGSGSVITKDVPDDAMAVERSPQNNREGGAKRYREMKMRPKAPKEG